MSLNREIKEIFNPTNKPKRLLELKNLLRDKRYPFTDVICRLVEKKKFDFVIKLFNCGEFYELFFANWSNDLNFVLNKLTGIHLIELFIQVNLFNTKFNKTSLLRDAIVKRLQSQELPFERSLELLDCARKSGNIDDVQEVIVQKLLLQHVNAHEQFKLVEFATKSNNSVLQEQIFRILVTRQLSYDIAFTIFKHAAEHCKNADIIKTIYDKLHKRICKSTSSSVQSSRLLALLTFLTEHSMGDFQNMIIIRLLSEPLNMPQLEQLYTFASHVANNSLQEQITDKLVSHSQSTDKLIHLIVFAFDKSDVRLQDIIVEKLFQREPPPYLAKENLRHDLLVEQILQLLIVAKTHTHNSLREHTVAAVFLQERHFSELLQIIVFSFEQDDLEIREHIVTAVFSQERHFSELIELLVVAFKYDNLAIQEYTVTAVFSQERPVVELHQILVVAFKYDNLSLEQLQETVVKNLLGRERLFTELLPFFKLTVDHKNTKLADKLLIALCSYDVSNWSITKLFSAFPLRNDATNTHMRKVIIEKVLQKECKCDNLVDICKMSIQHNIYCKIIDMVNKILLSDDLSPDNLRDMFETLLNKINYIENTSDSENVNTALQSIANKIEEERIFVTLHNTLGFDKFLNVLLLTVTLPKLDSFRNNIYTQVRELRMDNYQWANMLKLIVRSGNINNQKEVVDKLLRQTQVVLPDHTALNIVKSVLESDNNELEEYMYSKLTTDFIYLLQYSKLKVYANSNPGLTIHLEKLIKQKDAEEAKEKHINIFASSESSDY